MRDLKYVIVQQGADGQPRAIIFNGEICHSDMVPKGWSAVSAGFLHLELIGKLPQMILPIVSGRSTSLNLDSNMKDDVPVIYRTLTNQHYI